MVPVPVGEIGASGDKSAPALHPQRPAHSAAGVEIAGDPPSETLTAILEKAFLPALPHLRGQFQPKAEGVGLVEAEMAGKGHIKGLSRLEDEPAADPAGGTAGGTIQLSGGD